MAYKLLGGLLAAATMMTPLVPAYAASDTGISAQISNRIEIAQRDDRRGQRGDRSSRSTQRGERSRGEARQQAAQARQAEARREARSDRRDDRQSRRGDRRATQARVTTNDYRRDHRDDRQVSRQQERRDTRTTRDRSGATAVNRYRDQRRTADRRDARRYDDRRDTRRIESRRDQRSWSRDWRRDHRYDYRTYRNNHRNAYRLGRYHAPYRDYRYRRLNIGFSLGSLFYGNRYWINDPWQYRLPPAYYPYRWVRYYDDALLVDTRRGRVVDVIYGVFW